MFCLTSILTNDRALVLQQPDMIIAHLTRRNNTWKPIEESAVNTKPANPTDNSVLRLQSPAETNGSTLVSIQSLSTDDIARAQLRRRKLKERIRRLRIPLVLINSAWEIELFRSRSGWNINIRTLNYLPSNSLIFKAVRKGDLEMIKELFERGKASVNDVFENGATLLYVSFWS